jgi:hypothetical protein
MNTREGADAGTLSHLEQFASAQLDGRPDFQILWLSAIGRLRVSRGEFEEAIAPLEQAWSRIERDAARYTPEGLAVGIDLARSEARVGRAEQAQALLLEIVSSWPEGADPRSLLELHTTSARAGWTSSRSSRRVTGTRKRSCASSRARTSASTARAARARSACR